MKKEGGINHFKREGHADMYSPQIVSFVARQPNHVTFDIQSVSQLQAVMKQFRFQYVIFSDLQIYILSHLLVSVQCGGSGCHCEDPVSEETGQYPHECGYEPRFE